MEEDMDAGWHDAETMAHLEGEVERLRAALTDAERAALIGDAPHAAVICRRALRVNEQKS